MENLSIFKLFFGFLAGLHVACFGAYKDSPYEKFYLRRFFREIIASVIISLVISLVFPSLKSAGPPVLFLSVVALSRILTEGYKQFIRVENQQIYKIPSMVHFFGKIPQSIFQRLFIGILMLLVLFLAIFTSVKINNPVIIGFTIGILTALGGAYKDGFFEGFSLRKFFRSPIVASVCALLLSYKTKNPVFLFFAALGLERMIVEFYKGFVKSDYVPGKFKMEKAPYPQYFSLRKKLILPYILTWIIFLFYLIK